MCYNDYSIKTYGCQAVRAGPPKRKEACVMKKIRMAVLGAGERWKGLETLYVNHPHLEIVALCDIADGLAEDSAKRMLANTGYEPRVYRSYEELARNAVYDAIFITCDPDIQVYYAVREMDRGIHVMTEVPAA